MTLCGYTVPRTPEGRSSLVPYPPWHYVGAFLVIDYWADPERAVAFLPEGLDPHPDPGRCAFVAADWQSCSETGDELVDPSRSQYKEVFVVVNGLLDGEEVTVCSYIWVDRDFALMTHARARGCTRFDFGRSKAGTGPAAFKKNWGFEGRPLAYAKWSKGAAREINPLSPKYALMVRTWQRLPLPVANGSRYVSPACTLVTWPASVVSASSPSVTSSTENPGARVAPSPTRRRRRCSGVSADATATASSRLAMTSSISVRRSSSQASRS